LAAAVSASVEAYVLDQFQESLGGDTTVNNSRKLAQTFTPGLTEVLTFVDLGISGINTPGDLNVSITRTVSGMPSFAPADVLATVVAPEGSITAGWNRIDFEQEDLTLNEGEVYSILLEAGESQTFIRWHWYGDGTAYENGGIYTYQAIGQTYQWWEGPAPYWDPADSAFRTYMVPEPTALVLAAAGLAAIGRRRRD
jgi:hypothetical protein